MHTEYYMICEDTMLIPMHRISDNGETINISGELWQVIDNGLRYNISLTDYFQYLDTLEV